MTDEWTDRQVKICINDSDDGAILFCHDIEFMKRLAAFLEKADVITGPVGPDGDCKIPSIGLYFTMNDIKEGRCESEKAITNPIT